LRYLFIPSTFSSNKMMKSEPKDAIIFKKVIILGEIERVIWRR